MARNEYRLSGSVMALRLSQQKEALIDADALRLVGHLRWYAIVARHSFYAMAKERRKDGSYRLVSMHRLLMGEPHGLFVDHKDGNGLNNTRGNLRVATPQQNSQNKRRPSTNQSGLKGVSWHASSGKWRACIRHDKRLVSLGLHDSKEAAHAAYVEAAANLYGDFARAQ